MVTSAMANESAAIHCAVRTQHDSQFYFRNLIVIVGAWIKATITLALRLYASRNIQASRNRHWIMHHASYLLDIYFGHLTYYSRLTNAFF